MIIMKIATQAILPGDLEKVIKACNNIHETVSQNKTDDKRLNETD